MAQKKWHITIIEDGLLLSRGRSARFDFSSTVLIEGGADLRKSRMAHQVRQDLWRALQSLRGFSPAVKVCSVGSDLEITAGGAVEGPFPQACCEEAAAQVLACPDKMARWKRLAVRKSKGAA